ncbi:LysR family transcriptional regulator [Rhodobacterales bacterium HKCCE3408]|nr:LysR family transcriptional regulator [Rhodobacterales bacterium HKCCE3408]
MADLSDFDWTFVRSLLAVAEAGSLAGATRATGLSQPTLGRHIRLAEEALGQPIFTRHRRGLELNDFGTSLLPAMNRMREAAKAMELVATGADDSAVGTVRITASRFVSAFLMPSIIREMHEDLPEIDIELVATDTSENLLFHEADIAIRMYRPTQLDVVTKYIGALPLGLFATTDYLDRYGRPRTLDELEHHTVIGLDRDDQIIQGLRQVNFPVGREFFKLRCDDQVVCWQMIATGCGIGFGPLAVASLYPEVEHIMPRAPVPKLSVFLTAHERVRHSRKVSLIWNRLHAGLQPHLS